MLISAEGRGEGGGKVRMMFSDFRPVAKWKIPYKTEILANGQVVATYVVLSVQTNTGLSDDLFTATSEPASGVVDQEGSEEDQ